MKTIEILYLSNNHTTPLYKAVHLLSYLTELNAKRKIGLLYQRFNLHTCMYYIAYLTRSRCYILHIMFLVLTVGILSSGISPTSRMKSSGFLITTVCQKVSTSAIPFPFSFLCVEPKNDKSKFAFSIFSSAMQLPMHAYNYKHDN